MRRRRTCEHPLCAQRIKGASPMELGGLGSVVSPQAGSRGGAPESFCKVALRRRNLRAPQSPFLNLSKKTSFISIISAFRRCRVPNFLKFRSNFAKRVSFSESAYSPVPKCRGGLNSRGEGVALIKCIIPKNTTSVCGSVRNLPEEDNESAEVAQPVVRLGKP